MRGGIGLSCLSLMLGLCGLLTVERTAVGKAKRSRSHSHSHGHAHEGGEEDGKKKRGSHGHSHGSGFTFGAGVAVSQGFGGEAAAGESGGDSHGHAHGLLLHEGHDEGGEAESAEADGAEVEFAVTAGYRLSERLETELELGFSPESGINDPLLGVSHTLPLGKRLKLGSTLGLTLPVSEASRDTYKTTTVSASTGPTKTWGKLTLGLKAGIAMSWYSKTIIVEEEEEEHAELHRNLTLKRGFGLEEEHEEEEEHTIENGGTGDREFNRYSLSASTGYRLFKPFNLNANLGIAYVKNQFGPSTLESNVTLLQGTYTWKSMSAALAFLLSGSGESFTAPTSPGVSASINYLYE